MSCAADPLILTLRLEDRAAHHFTALRETYFPPALNLLPAHVTLFHRLPGTVLGKILDDLKAHCDRQANLTVVVIGLRFLGRGVAYRLESPRLSSLRKQLAQLWDAQLTLQDRQPFQPHITIQNKVSPDEARRVQQLLSATFRPWQITAVGLELWHYRGGPWESPRFFRSLSGH